MKAKLDTYAIAYVDGLAARVAELEAENRMLRSKMGGCAMSETYGTFAAAYVEAMRLRLSALEPENKHLAARVAELEACEKQRAEDEAWANDRTVLVEFHPLTSGWYASAPDGVVGINATAPTIHGALRALREKMEARP